MASPIFPAFSESGTGLTLGPGRLCAVCGVIPLNILPFEEEDAYPHHLTLGALEESGKTCALCALIYWAAACSLVDYGGMVSFHTVQLSSGAKVSSSAMESNYNRYGMRALDNGGMGIDLDGPVPDYRTPMQADLKLSFPNGIAMQNGVARPVRPWLFLNWYNSCFDGSDQLMIVGLGVRLGTSPRIEDAVGCSEENVKLRGSYLRLRTDQEVSSIPGRLRAADSGSSYAFNKLRGWLKLCDNHHSCISADTLRNLPTRVLDVAKSQDMVFLRETGGEKGKYLALSHSWGITHRLTLTCANLALLKEGILLSQIPKTFQDAVKIARELNVAYLWIDSLCILQDDAADWETEASHMGDVYADSYLTIAALSSKDDSSGCFPDPATRFNERFASADVRSTGRSCFFHAAPVVRWDDGQRLPTLTGRCTWATDEATDRDGVHTSWVYVTPEWMPPSRKDNPTTYLLGEFGGAFDPIADESLSERGWTLQERLLSPRTIHYGRTEMYWECQHCVFAEDGAMLRREFTTANDLWDPTLREPGKDRKWRWARLIEQYCTRKLTMDSDKLPALSGLVNMIATKTSDTYLAGLWKSNLLNELNWVIKANEPTHQCTDAEHDAAMPAATKSAVKYPAQYRAPSWSWASLDAEISYLPLKDELLATCVNVQVKPMGKDMFGRVESGKLTLKGPFYSLSRREFKDREGITQPLHVGVNATRSNKTEPVSNTNEISKEGTALFDTDPLFPSVALFLDANYALILKEQSGDLYTRVGRARFSGEAEEADKVDWPDGTVREVTII